MADYGGQINPMDIYSYVSGAYRASRDRTDKKNLAGYLSAAMQSDGPEQDAALASAAKLDPSAAMQFGGEIDKRQQDKAAQLAQLAQSVLSLPEEQQAMAYAQVVPQAQRLVGGQVQLPTAWSPEVKMKMQMAVAQGGGGVNARVQSTYVDAQGNRYAILRDGSTKLLGRDEPNTQIMDTGNGVVNIDKTLGTAAPVTMGEAPAAQAPPAGFMLDDAALQALMQVPPAERPAAFAAMTRGGTFHSGPDGAPVAGESPGLRTPPPELRTVPKPAEAARLEMDRARLALAEQANARAAEAAQRATAAAGTVTDQRNAAFADKRRKAQAAQADTVASYDDSIGAINTLLGSPGLPHLGTIQGDVETHIPLVRNDAKDAQAQLDTIKNRVLLDTIAKLKALSATGASGFGALSNQEGEILKNSIASLAGAQSNAQIVTNLRKIKTVLERSRDNLRGQAVNVEGEAPASPAATKVIRYDAQGNRIP